MSSNFHEKYSGDSETRRPPSGLKQNMLKSSSTGCLVNKRHDLNSNNLIMGGREEWNGIPILEKRDSILEDPDSRPQSRAYTASREDRTGLANQFRKPWAVRPQSSGAFKSLDERRRQMERYRGNRPKSSPVARSQRSPPASLGNGVNSRMSSHPASIRPASGQPRSGRVGGQLLQRKYSSPALIGRRKNSVTDSDVEELVVEHTTPTSKLTNPNITTTRERVESVFPDKQASPIPSQVGNCWTQQTAFEEDSKTPLSRMQSDAGELSVDTLARNVVESHQILDEISERSEEMSAYSEKSSERHIPTLVTHPQMHVTLNDTPLSSERPESPAEDLLVENNDFDRSVEPGEGRTAKLAVDSDIDNRRDSAHSDDSRHLRRSSLLAETGESSSTTEAVGRRSRSDSRVSFDGRRRSLSPAAEPMVRRARRERRRKLMHYQNTRLNRKAETAREKLKRVITTVRVIAGICLALKSYVKKEETTRWSLHEMHLNLRADMEKTLAFDLIMFSKLRVTRGSEKLKSILALKPEHRTRTNIEVVLALLRKNKAFSEYQKETQILLVKYMEYLRFEPRRIVVKEGHVASGFYIILSGTCLVNQKEVDPRTNETFVRTITQLTSGESFGENSLLHDTVRAATVVCKDEVEVLLINKDDFDDIIKKPVEQKRDELIEFCHAHDIYICATTETLVSQPRAIYTKFFKPGILITDDIMSSEYIYVVKEGKCNVVAEIKEVKKQGQKGQLPPRYLMHDESWKKDAALKRSMAVLAHASGKDRRWSAAARNKLYPPEKKEKTFFSLNAINVKDSTDDYMRNRKQSVQLALEEPPKFLLGGENIRTKKKDPPEESVKSAISRTWKRMSVTASALSQKEEKQNPVEYAPPNKIKTTYAKLASLKRGMAFGIESLLPGTQPEAKLSLISEGTEVILVSKRLFASDVSSTTLKTASKMAVDYPSIDFTRGVLEEARVWTSYKSDLMKEIYHKKLERRPVQPK